MSGVSFVAGWVYAFGGDAEKLMKGPYDAATKASWDKAFADLKEFNKNAVITPGNAGTLDMLNRGEIAIGPVWVDMFYSWQTDDEAAPEHEAQARLARHARPADVLRRAGESAQKKLAEAFIALATSPQVQTDGIVKKFNWYPGIDAKNLEGKLDKAAWDKLFWKRHPGRARQERQALPDRALLQRHPRGLREEGRELRFA